MGHTPAPEAKVNTRPGGTSNGRWKVDKDMPRVPREKFHAHDAMMVTKRSSKVHCAGASANRRNK